MDFRTEINLTKANFDINHQDKLLLIGSCFSSNIGQKLQHALFDVSINPFGTIYNAFSISKLIKRALSNKTFEASEFHFNDTSECYYHYDLHSEFNKENLDEMLAKCNESLSILKTYLTLSKTIIITLGTSYVFKNKEHGIVANCHKMPQRHFEKELLSIDLQVGFLQEVVNETKKWNPEVQFIFTVSPVRHTKEGLTNNSLSKSILRVVCDEITALKNTTYFPSFEIVMDDLRDYRFIKSDLIHPNEVAIEYIWRKFSATFFSRETSVLLDKIEAIQHDLSHRHMNPNSMTAKKHIDSTKLKIAILKKEKPHLLTFL